MQIRKLRKKERAAAAAIAETPIASGFGHAMLLKMGWAGEGSGLREGAIARPLGSKVLPTADKGFKLGKRGLIAVDEIRQTSLCQQQAAPAGSEPLVLSSKKKKQKKRRAPDAPLENGEAATTASDVALENEGMVGDSATVHIPSKRTGAKLNSKRKAQLRRRKVREESERIQQLKDQLDGGHGTHELTVFAQ